jgi:BMFP domain-containing protein YqiC
LSRNIPPTKADVVTREAFLGEVLSKLAGQAAALTERLDALEEDVAKLEEPKPKKQ